MTLTVTRRCLKNALVARTNSTRIKTTIIPQKGLVVSLSMVAFQNLHDKKHKKLLKKEHES